MSSLHQVAILIPFRNRYEHLPVLFRHLIPMLQRQRLQFAFYVVEQVSEHGAGSAALKTHLPALQVQLCPVPRGVPARSHLFGVGGVGVMLQCVNCPV